jgi:thiosulfate dehydrogenase
MPFDEATWKNPKLTDEEAWDVAAYIASQPRPQKFFSYDWKDIFKKPFDHPFGPYADNFSEQQHKYGPFELIKKADSALIKQSITTSLK